MVGWSDAKSRPLLEELETSLSQNEACKAKEAHLEKKLAEQTKLLEQEREDSNAQTALQVRSRVKFGMKNRERMRTNLDSTLTCLLCRSKNST